MKQKRTEKTQNAILSAARALFVRHGFAGTAMGRIAEKANVNHSLLFHHFGNKQGLWTAVKQQIVAEAAQNRPILPDTQQSLESFLTQALTQSIDFYRSEPDIVRMIGWQRLEGSNNTTIDISRSKDAKAWLAALQIYQDRGQIRADISIEFVLIQILSLASSAAMDWSMLVSDEQRLQQYIQFCVKGWLSEI